MRPAVLLIAFVALIRTVPGLTRPAAAPQDCSAGFGRADVGAMERCLAVRTSDVELMIDLARAYERAGHADRAEALYRRALTIDPDDGELRRRLAQLAAGGRGGA